MIVLVVDVCQRSCDRSTPHRPPRHRHAAHHHHPCPSTPLATPQNLYRAARHQYAESSSPNAAEPWSTNPAANTPRSKDRRTAGLESSSASPSSLSAVKPAGSPSAVASPSPAGAAQPTVVPRTGNAQDLIHATTTSTQDSGLLDVLIPLFQQQTASSVLLSWHELSMPNSAMARIASAWTWVASVPAETPRSNRRRAPAAGLRLSGYAPSCVHRNRTRCFGALSDTLDLASVDVSCVMRHNDVLAEIIATRPQDAHNHAREGGSNELGEDEWHHRQWCDSGKRIRECPGPAYRRDRRSSSTT